ncbi:uncharacterized protein YndB with AHSA1/START domain [Kribbella steppae]|uniref:Uncharacterized protein YndB with AHSA1/START domain n=1 Tax=Kribbella steppae TaxID=2512223 RepID=A0A4R2H8P3_9ACTN|nr:SRPBCC family protein [Kribbella steppae]TCO23288.1 uncharacterized protein YndB with AHSA1/START domain [Kribbella steppae]
MTNLGTITSRGTVRLERVYPVDTGTLWSYLTTKDGLSRWIADGEIGPERVSLVFHDNPDYPITGAVLVWEPPQVAEFEWNGGSTQPQDSVVRIELTPEENGTRLVLTHSRITDPTDAPDFAAGWHFHLDTLDSLVLGTQPPTDRPTWDHLHAHYVKAIPAHRA